MAKELVSVIINVYNGEKYIRKCLDSVLKQTYENLEILIINDGSTDGTLEICKTYKDKRLRITTTENKGLSASRGVGISKAKGEYLYFVDVDDVIEPDTIEYLYGLCKKHKAKMATCGVSEKMNHNSLKNKKDDVKVFTAEEYLKKNVMSVDYAINLWNKLMKKDIFENVVFLKEVISDDLATTYKLTIAAGRIVMGKSVKYYYIRNDDSMTVKWKNDFKRSVDIYNISITRYNDIKKVYPNMVENDAGMLRNIVLLYTRRNKELHKYLDEHGAKESFKKIYNRKVFWCDCRMMDKIIILIFRMSPGLYEFLLKIYLKVKKCFGERSYAK